MRVARGSSALSGAVNPLTGSRPQSISQLEKQ